MADSIKNILIFLFKTLSNWLEDILIISGFLIVLYNTYNHFGAVIGNYLLGVLLLLGLVIAKK